MLLRLFLRLVSPLFILPLLLSAVVLLALLPFLLLRLLGLLALRGLCLRLRLCGRCGRISVAVLVSIAITSSAAAVVFLPAYCGLFVFLFVHGINST